MAVRGRHFLPHPRKIQYLRDFGTVLSKIILKGNKYALVYSIGKNHAVIQYPAADHIRIVSGVQIQVQPFRSCFIGEHTQFHTYICLLFKLVKHIKFIGFIGAITEYGKAVGSLIYKGQSLLIHYSVHFSAVICPGRRYTSFLGSISSCRRGIAAFAAACQQTRTHRRSQHQCNYSLFHSFTSCFFYIYPAHCR